ncbi:TNF receptor-associated factor 4 [Oopsacas minuta]|uniref:TNF receptor-associated factor 4 n=1 Tax=Oopsacas minuta TaxID=111878 RepID=A0AAV7JES7_9METZ|nr:TNF receptor-associated factor 4 [Oopsacas minuta]
MALNILVSEKGRDLCRVRGEGGKFLGFRKDILTENLTERDNTFLSCTRCQGILREACISTTSGEQFCSCCSKKGEQTHQNAHVSNTVFPLKCSCPLFNRGCDWLGKLGECENHLDLCGHVHEKCKLGCDIVLPRHELSSHIREECTFRKIPCEHCQRGITPYDMLNHLEKCQKIPLSCELGCGIILCREDMAQHLEEECVEKKVECPFRKYKCEVGLIKRKELNQHLKEKRTEHTELKLSAMEEIIMQQSKETELVKAETEQLTHKVEDLEIEARELKQTLLFITKATKLEWRINNIENIMNFKNLTIPAQVNFQVAGYLFELQFSCNIATMLIEFYPRDGRGYQNLKWPFKAELVIHLICHNNTKGTKEFRSEMIEVKKEDYRSSKLKIKLATFPKSEITDEYVKEGGIEFEIFLFLL